MCKNTQNGGQTLLLDLMILRIMDYILYSKLFYINTKNGGQTLLLGLINLKIMYYTL